jgi:hypothetical protein
MRLRSLFLIAVLAFAVGCGGEGVEYAEAPEAARPAIKLEVEAPEPLPMPEYREPASETDWESRVNNKDREVIELLNIIYPVAAYITEGFNQYGDRFSATVEDEWEDTQVQLTRAMTLYEDCKSRRGAGTLDKQLFLDLEEVWQLLVKTGVAGVRTQSMVDSELRRIAG